MRWVTYECISSKEVRDVLVFDVVHQPAIALVVLPPVDEELIARVLVNEWTDEGPEDREDARRAHNQQEAHCLRVVGFNNLDDMKQGLDTRSPQVAHAQTLQVHDARAVTEHNDNPIG